MFSLVHSHAKTKEIDLSLSLIKNSKVFLLKNNLNEKSDNKYLDKVILYYSKMVYLMNGSSINHFINQNLMSRSNSYFEKVFINANEETIFSLFNQGSLNNVIVKLETKPKVGVIFTYDSVGSLFFGMN